MPEFDPHRLRARRDHLGLTRAELGRRASRTESAIYKYEMGTLTPSIVTLERVCEALDCPIESLFDPTKPARRTWLTPQQLARIRAQKIPRLTDAQLESIAAVIEQSRLDALVRGGDAA